MSNLLEESAFWATWVSDSNLIRNLLVVELQKCVNGADKRRLFPRLNCVDNAGETYSSDTLEQYLVLLLRGYAANLSQDGIDSKKSPWHHDKVSSVLVELIRKEKELTDHLYRELTQDTNTVMVCQTVVTSAVGNIVSLLYDHEDPSLPIPFVAGKLRLFTLLLEQVTKLTGEETRVVLNGLLSLDLVDALRPPGALEVRRLEIRDVTMRFLKQQQYNMTRESAEGFAILMQQTIHMFQHCPFNNSAITVHELAHRGLLGIGILQNFDYIQRKTHYKGYYDVDSWADLAVNNAERLYDHVLTTTGSYKINTLKAIDVIIDAFESVLFGPQSTPERYRELYLKNEGNAGMVGNISTIGAGAYEGCLRNTFPGFALVHPATPFFLLFLKKMNHTSLVQLLTWKLTGMHLPGRQLSVEELSRIGFQTSVKSGETPLSFLSIVALLVYTEVVSITDLSPCQSPDKEVFVLEAEKLNQKLENEIKSYSTISLVEEEDTGKEPGESTDEPALEDTVEPFFACNPDSSSLTELTVRDSRYGLLSCLFALQTAELYVAVSEPFAPLDNQWPMCNTIALDQRMHTVQYKSELTEEQMEMISMGLASENTLCLHHTYTPTPSVVDYIPGLLNMPVVQSYYAQMHTYLDTCEYIDMYVGEKSNVDIENRVYNTIFGHTFSLESKQQSKIRSNIFMAGSSGLFASCVTARVSVFVNAALLFFSKNVVQKNNAQCMLKQLTSLLLPVKQALSLQPNVLFRLLQLLKKLILVIQPIVPSNEYSLPTCLDGHCDLKSLPYLSNVLLECVLPSYSACAGSVLLSGALWEVQSLLSAADRYSLYSAWDLFVYQTCPQLRLVRAQSVRRARFVRKRAAVGLMGDLSRSSHLYLYANPQPALMPFLEHVRIMASVVGPVEELLGHLPALHTDVTLFLVCRMLAEGGPLQRNDSVLDLQWVQNTGALVAGLLSTVPERMDLSVYIDLIARQTSSNVSFSNLLATLLAVGGAQVDVLDGDQDAALQRCGGPILASYAAPALISSKDKLYQQTVVCRRLFREKLSKASRAQAIAMGPVTVITTAGTAVVSLTRTPSVPVPISALYLEQALRPHVRALFIALGRLEQDCYKDAVDQYQDVYEKVMQTIRLLRCFLETYLRDESLIARCMPSVYELTNECKVRVETALNLLQPWLHLPSVCTMPEEVSRDVIAAYSDVYSKYLEKPSIQIVPPEVYVLFLHLFPSSVDPLFTAWRYFRAPQRLNLRDVYNRKLRDLGKQHTLQKEEQSKQVRTKAVSEGQVEGAVKLNYGDLIVVLTFQTHLLKEQEAALKNEQQAHFQEGKRNVVSFLGYLESTEHKPSVMKRDCRIGIDENTTLKHMNHLHPISESLLFTDNYITECVVPAARFSTSSVVMLSRLQREHMSLVLIHPIYLIYRVLHILPSMFAISTQQEIQRLAVYILDLLTGMSNKILHNKGESWYIQHNSILSEESRIFPSEDQDKMFILDADIMLTRIMVAGLHNDDIQIMQTSLNFAAKIISSGCGFPQFKDNIDCVERVVSGILHNNGDLPVFVLLCKQVLGGLDKCRKNGIIKTNADIQLEKEEEERVVLEEMERLKMQEMKDVEAKRENEEKRKLISDDDNSKDKEDEDPVGKKTKRAKRGSEKSDGDDNKLVQLELSGKQVEQSNLVEQGNRKNIRRDRDDQAKKDENGKKTNQVAKSALDTAPPGTATSSTITNTTNTSSGGPTFSRHLQFKQQQQQAQQQSQQQPQQQSQQQQLNQKVPDKSIQVQNQPSNNNTNPRDNQPNRRGHHDNQQYARPNQRDNPPRDGFRDNQQRDNQRDNQERDHHHDNRRDNQQRDNQRENQRDNHHDNRRENQHRDNQRDNQQRDNQRDNQQRDNQRDNQRENYHRDHHHHSRHNNNNRDEFDNNPPRRGNAKFNNDFDKNDRYGDRRSNRPRRE